MSEYEISVVVDENPESPREWENFGTMVCWHKDYELGDVQPKCCDPVDWLSDLLDELDVEAFVDDPDSEWDIDSLLYALAEEAVILPLYLYDHGELWMSTDNSHWPFNCPWDCGQVGWIYADRPHVEVEFGGWNAEAREKARESMEKEIETYSSYLHGAVFGWMVQYEGEIEDSCWGYYDENNALADAQEVVDFLVNKKEKEGAHRA